MSWFLYIVLAIVIYIVGRWLLRGGILIICLIGAEIMHHWARKRARERANPTPKFKLKHLLPRKK